MLLLLDCVVLMQVFKPDRANAFDVQSEVEAFAEEELHRPKQLTTKAR